MRSSACREVVLSEFWISLRKWSSASRCAFAIEVYETHATLALQSNDLGEFGACQAALVPLHAARASARAAEFGAYRLLHAATLRGASLAAELYGILSSLRPDHATHPAVLQALRVGIAMQLDDHLSVLGELPSLRYHGACLLRPKLQRLREQHSEQIGPAYAGHHAISSGSKACSQIEQVIAVFSCQPLRWRRAR